MNGDSRVLYQDSIPRLETDKLTEEYTLRIPEITKYKINKMTKQQRRSLNERLLIEMAKSCHWADFDPCQYLRSD